ncbi:MAG: hypothetical protein JRG82_19210 [Deltaproteobacteria bacterium]|nr:hypothetical protein [Deltaproteobacteria bacterium]
MKPIGPLLALSLALGLLACTAEQTAPQAEVPQEPAASAETPATAPHRVTYYELSKS